MRETLALVFMVRQDRRSWTPAAVWGAVAAASLAAAVWVAVQPGRLHDLHQVRQWLSFVEQNSGNPYSHFDSQLDYPPIALLFLRPLGMIPEESLAAWFLPASILLTALAGWVLVGAIAGRLNAAVPTPHRVALVALLLAGGSVRGAIWLGQTVALSILFGALALGWSRRRPFAAALALALCSFKPHLAIGFGLAILFADGLKVVVAALAIAILASLIAAASMNQPAVALLIAYAGNLLSMYDGAEGIRGLLSVRWIIQDAVGHYRLAQLLYALIACASVAWIGAIAKRAQDDAGRTQAISAAMIWPLLFLPSQLYNGLMAAPALWLLMWPESGLIRSESRRLIAVAGFALVAVLDIPRALRFGSDVLEDGYWLYRGSYYLDPVAIFAVFGFILLRAFHLGGTSGPLGKTTV